jgi:hypothetical protein
MLCGAKTRAGSPCKKYSLEGRTRCRLHGGASHPGGPSHHRYIHGKRSKAYIENARRVRAELRLLEHLGRAYGLFVK